MSLDQTYDPDNIFAKIIRGDMPCVKILETDNVLSFMDVFPQSTGHSLIIHKQAQATNLLNAEPGTLIDLVGATQKVAQAAHDALSPDGIRIVQFNGAPAGQTVYHLHFHVIPIFDGEPIGKHAGGGPAPAEILEPIAARLRSAITSA